MGLLMLGVSDAMLGVAWPSMRASFGAPLAGLGVVLAAITAGFLVSSTATSTILIRLAMGGRMVLAAAGVCVALGGFALSPTWPALVVAAVVYGAAAGLLDPGLNSFIAIRHSNRELNLLHAGYGLGAGLGPLVMTAFLLAGLVWRLAYLAILLLEAALLAAFLLLRHSWPRFEATATDLRPAGSGGALALGLLGFFIYSGIEVSAGAWSFSFLTIGHGIGTAPAGFVVGAFWAAITAGRVLAGVLATRVRNDRLLQAAVLLAVAGAALALAWPAAGLPLLGLGLAPIFPTLVSLTPGAQGNAHVTAAVGYQLAAGSLGASLLPALAGLALQRYGVLVLPVLLLAATILQLLLAFAAGRRYRLSISGSGRSS